MFARWLIVVFKTECSKYYLMLVLLVKRQINTRIHHQIQFRSEDKIDTGCKFRSYGLGFRAFKACCITVVRLCIGITNGSNKGVAAKRTPKIISKLLQKVS